MTAIPVRTTQARLDSFGAHLAPERDDDPEWQPRLSEEARRAEAAFAARSLAVTRDRVAGALSVPCSEHEAAPGVFCFDEPTSGVRGFCRSRYRTGVVIAGAQPASRSGRTSSGFIDELDELAAANRYAQRDMRIRERAAHRHPNRQGVGR
jgi:hypothetical protein